MFKETRILPFFPTAVWTHTLASEVYEPLNESLKPAVYEAVSSTAGPVRRSGETLHEDPAFADLTGIVKQAAKGVLDFLEVEYAGLEITACWANVMSQDAPEQRPHAHPNSYLSGAYYVQVQEGANVINLHDPRSQTGVILPKTKKITEYNTRDINLTVKTGSLIIFPAWLEHSVPLNSSAEDRISINFDLMYTPGAG